MRSLSNTVYLLGCLWLLLCQESRTQHCEWQIRANMKSAYVSEVWASSELTYAGCKISCISKMESHCLSVNFHHATKECEHRGVKSHPVRLINARGWSYMMRPSCAAYYLAQRPSVEHTLSTGDGKIRIRFGQLLEGQAVQQIHGYKIMCSLSIAFNETVPCYEGIVSAQLDYFILPIPLPSKKFFVAIKLVRNLDGGQIEETKQSPPTTAFCAERRTQLAHIEEFLNSDRDFEVLIQVVLDYEFKANEECADMVKVVTTGYSSDYRKVKQGFNRYFKVAINRGQTYNLKIVLKLADDAEIVFWSGTYRANITTVNDFDECPWAGGPGALQSYIGGTSRGIIEGISEEACKVKCINQTYLCSAINYKSTGNQCKLLVESNQTATVQPTPGWKYLNRPICAGLWLPWEAEKGWTTNRRSIHEKKVSNLDDCQSSCLGISSSSGKCGMITVRRQPLAIGSNCKLHTFNISEQNDTSFVQSSVWQYFLTPKWYSEPAVKPLPGEMNGLIDKGFHIFTDLTLSKSGYLVGWEYLMSTDTACKSYATIVRGQSSTYTVIAITLLTPENSERSSKRFQYVTGNPVRVQSGDMLGMFTGDGSCIHNLVAASIGHGSRFESFDIRDVSFNQQFQRSKGHHMANPSLNAYVAEYLSHKEAPKIVHDRFLSDEKAWLELPPPLTGVDGDVVGGYRIICSTTKKFTKNIECCKDIVLKNSTRVLLSGPEFTTPIYTAVRIMRNFHGYLIPEKKLSPISKIFCFGRPRTTAVKVHEGLIDAEEPKATLLITVSHPFSRDDQCAKELKIHASPFNTTYRQINSTEANSFFLVVNQGATYDLILYLKLADGTETIFWASRHTTKPGVNSRCQWNSGKGRLTPYVPGPLANCTVRTSHICRHKCTSQTSFLCAAVNYNSIEGECQLLVENEQTTSVSTDSNWRYYIRPLCAGIWLPWSAKKGYRISRSRFRGFSVNNLQECTTKCLKVSVDNPADQCKSVVMATREKARNCYLHSAAGGEMGVRKHITFASQYFNKPSWYLDSSKSSTEASIKQQGLVGANLHIFVTIKVPTSGYLVAWQYYMTANHDCMSYAVIMRRATNKTYYPVALTLLAPEDDVEGVKFQFVQDEAIIVERDDVLAISSENDNCNIHTVSVDTNFGSDTLTVNRTGLQLYQTVSTNSEYRKSTPALKAFISEYLLFSGYPEPYHNHSLSNGQIWLRLPPLPKGQKANVINGYKITCFIGNDKSVVPCYNNSIPADLKVALLKLPDIRYRYRAFVQLARNFNGNELLDPTQSITSSFFCAGRNRTNNVDISESKIKDSHFEFRLKFTFYHRFQLTDECVREMKLNTTGYDSGYRKVSANNNESFRLRLDSRQSYKFIIYLKLADGGELTFWEKSIIPGQAKNSKINGLCTCSPCPTTEPDSIHASINVGLIIVLVISTIYAAVITIFMISKGIFKWQSKTEKIRNKIKNLKANTRTLERQATKMQLANRSMRFEQLASHRSWKQSAFLQ